MKPSIDIHVHARWIRIEWYSHSRDGWHFHVGPNRGFATWLAIWWTKHCDAGLAVGKRTIWSRDRTKTYPNGAPMFAPDGTMLDDKGNRSIFDDVDAFDGRP